MRIIQKILRVRHRVDRRHVATHHTKCIIKDFKNGRHAVGRAGRIGDNGFFLVRWVIDAHNIGRRRVFLAGAADITIPLNASRDVFPLLPLCGIFPRIQAQYLLLLRPREFPLGLQPENTGRDVFPTTNVSSCTFTCVLRDPYTWNHGKKRYAEKKCQSYY